MGRRGGNEKYFHKNKMKKRDLDRSIKKRKIRSKVIIACEDSVSSPIYFKTFINDLIQKRDISPYSIVIVAHDGKTHPTGVLNNLKSYNKDGLTYKDFDERWIVIDRDNCYKGGGHSREDFNNAFIQAKKSKVNVAYANDSFELWYLLHFEYRDTSILRDEIIKRVIFYLKKIDEKIFKFLNKNNFKQEKYSKQIYNFLSKYKLEAVKNAKKLISSYNPHNPEKDNPSTNIYSLIEVLSNI